MRLTLCDDKLCFVVSAENVNNYPIMGAYGVSFEPQLNAHEAIEI